MRYQQPTPITKTEASLAYAARDTDKTVDAIIRVSLHETDRSWAESFCLRGLMDSRIPIVEAAITGIGHVARLHGDINSATLEALRHLLGHPTLSGRAQDALDDIETFARR